MLHRASVLSVVSPLLAMLALATGAAADPVIPVPRATGAIRIDGQLDEPDWSKAAARTPPLVDAGGRAQPHNELRFLADDANLYVMFYAADQDLRTRPRPRDARGAQGDRVTLTLNDLVLDLRPNGGKVPDGVRVAMDVDGTIDRSSDEDEEWVVEIAVPWRLLGVDAARDGVRLRALRLDAPKGEPERALAFPPTGFARLVRRP